MKNVVVDSSKYPMTEMSQEDLQLLAHFLREKKPRKVVEIGVSAGATTAFILDELPSDAVLYSVDIDTRCYSHPTFPVGFMALDRYTPEAHPQWVRFFGMDISECIREIGPGIDFVILDTTHTLPGEVLSFLAVLPFMADKSILVLHDIGLQTIYKLRPEYPDPREQCAYCTSLLFNAISSPQKFSSLAAVPNCGAVIISKQQAMLNIFQVINMLFVNWWYLPPKHILDGTMDIVRERYSDTNAELIEKAIRYNAERLKTSPNKP